MDSIEIQFHSLFADRFFPSYKIFWLKEVEPITNRNPPYFKTNAELDAMGKSVLHWYSAQLNYSVLYHLGVAYQTVILSDEAVEYNRLLASMTHLVGATDIAFELLQLWTNKTIWPRILLDCISHFGGSREIQLSDIEQWTRNPGLSTKKAQGLSQVWRMAEKKPLEDIRKYRNALVHRGVRSIWFDGKISRFPQITKEDQYCDWRQPPKEEDYSPASGVLKPAWEQTADYIEKQWKNHLLI